MIDALLKGDLGAAKAHLSDKVTFVDHASATSATGVDASQKLGVTAMKGLSGLHPRPEDLRGRPLRGVLW